MTEVGDGTLTLDGRGGDTTVAVDGARVVETAAGTVGDVSPGDAVLVLGPRTGDGQLTARHVAARPAGDLAAPSAGQGRHAWGSPWRVGTVVSNDGSTLVVETAHGEVTVRTTADTRVSVTRVIDPTQVEVGDRVLARGTWQPDGSLAAAAVHVNGLTPAGERPEPEPEPTTTTTAPAPPTSTPEPPPTEQAPARAEVEGEVLSVDGDRILLRQDDGSTVDVRVTEATRWGGAGGRGRSAAGGAHDRGIASVQVGERLKVLGIMEGDVLVADLVIDVDGPDDPRPHRDRGHRHGDRPDRDHRDHDRRGDRDGPDLRDRGERDRHDHDGHGGRDSRGERDGRGGGRR